MNVKVRVSEAYALLRETQRRLNDFVWSTEICYGHTLAANELQSQRSRMVDEVLAGVKAEAWYPPAKHRNVHDDEAENLGRGKYRHTVDNFLGHVERNTRYIYLNCIVMFSTAFEEYLESRRDDIDPREPNGKRKGSWGPYCQSLCGPSVQWEGSASTRGFQRPIQMGTVLTGDVARLLRNQIVHSQHALVLSINDSRVDAWSKDLTEKLNASSWQRSVQSTNPVQRQRDAEHSVHNAIKGFLGAAEHKVKRARDTQGKELPIEFFYMLFTLTALDALAFEIEEAVIKESSEAAAFVLIDEARVKRRDLLALPPRKAGGKEIGRVRQRLG
jgi:hypothetical protein